MKRYLYNLLIAIDQLFNALLNGYPDETISSRCDRNHTKWYWHWLYSFLNWLSPNHCEKALQSEKLDLHSPIEVR